LIDESSYSKTQIKCDHIGAVYSGLGPDFIKNPENLFKITMSNILSLSVFQLYAERLTSFFKKKLKLEDTGLLESLFLSLVTMIMDLI
jgi:hypothetical protein